MKIKFLKTYNAIIVALLAMLGFISYVGNTPVWRKFRR